MARPLPFAPANGGHRGRIRAPLAGAIGLALLTALVLYVLRPSPPTDDTFAFLDWGRDVRHGLVPDINGRTFHPVPVLYGAVISVVGDLAPPVTVVLSLAALLLVALAAWRIVARLGVQQPGPAVAAVLVLVNPMLPALAFAAYVNLWFALLILWAAACDLEGRHRLAWALLLLSGLVRPEGWAYLVCYGLLSWTRSGRQLAPLRWLPLAALALSPLIAWVGIEWLAFGSPMYSFTHTAKLVDTAAHRTGHLTVVGQVWHDLRDGVTWPVMPFVLLGVAASIRRPLSERAGLYVLALSAPLTIVVLALSGLNLPSRHFSVLVSFGAVFAAVGAMRVPALVGGAAGRLRSAPRTAPRLRAVALGSTSAGAVLIVGALSVSANPLRDEVRSVREARAYTHSLASAIAARRPELRGLRFAPQTVAIVGAIAQSELAWALRVPYADVTGELVPETRMIVQPSPQTWSQLSRAGLTDRPRTNAPPSWLRIADGRWEIYLAPELAAGLSSPLTSVISSGRQRTLGSIARVMTRSR